MRNFMIPPVIFHMLLFYMKQGVQTSKDIDCIDFFAGVGRIKDSFQKKGYAAVAYEINNDSQTQDFLSVEGWITAFTWVLRLTEEGMTHWGTVCSTWVWISRAITGRSSENPLGFPDSKVTQDANVMVSRMCLLLLLVVSKGGSWLLEQPASSLMTKHPRFSHMALAKTCSRLSRGWDVTEQQPESQHACGATRNGSGL